MKPVIAIGATVATLALAVAAEGIGSIGYPSVAAALLAVQRDESARTAVQDGWTIVQTTEDGKAVLWSFTQKGHPAHPSAVKRTLMEKDGALYIDMRALCEAPKVECDKLMEEFKQLNEQMMKRENGGG